jgi:hypothetical protein
MPSLKATGSNQITGDPATSLSQRVLVLSGTLVFQPFNREKAHRPSRVSLIPQRFGHGVWSWGSGLRLCDLKGNVNRAEAGASGVSID